MNLTVLCSGDGTNVYDIKLGFFGRDNYPRVNDTMFVMNDGCIQSNPEPRRFNQQNEDVT